MNLPFLFSTLAFFASVVGSEVGPPKMQADEPLDALNGVRIEEKLRASIPSGLRFVTSSGESISSEELFQGSKPTLLTLNYSDCPMLCSVHLNGLVESISAMGWTLGDEYRIVTLSLNPDESPERAAQTKKRYIEQYGRGGAGGWTYVVADPSTIQTVADAVGFGFRKDEETGEIHHTAAVIVLSPAGQVARYLYGVQYSPQTLRLSMVEATEGKFASTLDQIILYCFRYDPLKGTYSPLLRNVMRIGGGAFLTLMALILLPVWLRRQPLRTATGEVGS